MEYNLLIFPMLFKLFHHKYTLVKNRNIINVFYIWYVLYLIQKILSWIQFKFYHSPYLYVVWMSQSWSYLLLWVYCRNIQNNSYHILITHFTCYLFIMTWLDMLSRSIWKSQTKELSFYSKYNLMKSTTVHAKFLRDDVIFQFSYHNQSIISFYVS